MPRVHALLIALALALAGLLGVGAWQQSAGQPVARPTTCEEEIVVGNIFIGHNCGEFASILISGRIVIERPWSRTNRASRAVRLRNRRGETATRPAATATPTPRAKPTRTPRPNATSTPRPNATATPRSNATSTPTRTPRGRNNRSQDVNCDDFQTRQEAQRYFDRQGWSANNDPYDLDETGVGDGVPCESLPSR